MASITEASATSTYAPSAYPDLIRLDPSEFEIVQPSHSPRLGRPLVSVVMAVLVGVFGYGVYASGLGAADQSAFNAGTQTVSSGCQTNAVQTKLVTSRLPGQSGFWATGVQVSQIDSTNCAGAVVDVLGTDTSDNAIGQGSHTVVDGTSNFTVTFDTPADATKINAIAMIIRA